MSKFSVEFKVKHITATSTEVRHVKTVLDDPAQVGNLVQDATSQGGGLEFLTVRQVKEKVVKPKVEVKK